MQSRGIQMDLAALLECVSNPSCLFTQLASALVLAMILFLVILLVTGVQLSIMKKREVQL